MKLSDYMDMHNTTLTELALWLGGVHKSQASRIANGRLPTFAQMQMIHEKTKGKVSYSDFAQEQAK